MEIRIETIEGIAAAARAFIDAMGDHRVFAFYGAMGVGKTTFIKALCKALGVEDIVTSPTFAIVNEYRTTQGEPVYHFDFYRLRRLSEAFDMGCEEYFQSGNLCFIEWPEIVEEALPDDTVRVTLTELPDGTRLIRE